MAIVSQQPGSIGGPRGDGEVSERSTLVAILAELNGNLDSANLKDQAATAAKVDDALAAILGVTRGGSTRRGKAIIDTAQAVPGAAYAKLATPDEVQNIVLPTDGLIVVSYHAVWQESVDGAARAAIFVGANQLKVADASAAAPIVQETNCGGSGGLGGVGADSPLFSYGGGLTGISMPAGYAGDVATGQVVGGTGAANGALGPPAPCLIFAAAGAYTVSVQFKVSGGNAATVKNRRLRVWTMGF